MEVRIYVCVVLVHDGLAREGDGRVVSSNESLPSLLVANVHSRSSQSIAHPSLSSMLSRSVGTLDGRRCLRCWSLLSDRRLSR